jgi:hypothetical protein
MMNSLVMGPILGFRGLTEDGNWCTSALFVTRDDTLPQVTLAVDKKRQEPIEPIRLKSLGEHHVWRAQWAVRQTAAEQKIGYSVDGGETNLTYVVPAQDQPLRIAYGSC